VWPKYTIKYMEDGREKTMEMDMTFADFAVTETRFRKHFRKAPRDTWNDNMVPLAEFLEMAEDEREDLFPYIWVVDKKQQLSRLLVSKAIVESCEDRKDFWIMLKALAGVDKVEPSKEDMENEIRSDIIQKLAAGLLELAGDGGGQISIPATAAQISPAEAAAPEATGADGYVAPWLDTEKCTACDECVVLNPKIFAYNDNKKAYIKDPNGGPYRDIVKAAEKCTAQVIHPGLPKNRSEKDVDKWIKRGEKFN
jgi:pyruvate-ferredoxin/flavodoxin oxidoreductase